MLQREVQLTKKVSRKNIKQNARKGSTEANKENINNNRQSP